MKKYFFLFFAAALLLALPAQAGLKWGLKAGVNLSNVNFDIEDLDPDNYTGFQVGPMVEFTLPIVGIGFDAGLLYSQNGFKIKEEGVSETFKSGSILIPVNLKYKLSLMNLVGAYATAGPYVDFRIHDNFDDIFKDAPSDMLKSETFGAGLNFGLGVELLGKLQVGANYQLGLTDDYKSDGFWGTAENALDAKTQVWSITAAFFF